VTVVQAGHAARTPATTPTLPDAGDRYLSVVVVNNDRYINDVLHEPGGHHIVAG
jgi:hypothetical protein